MVQVEHTFDTTCRQTPVRTAERDTGMPYAKAQFFYSSSIPIDDPLSASSHTATTDLRQYKGLLRPFSRGDNNALEAAWLSLATDTDRIRHAESRAGKPKSKETAARDAEFRESITQSIAQKHAKLHSAARRGHDLAVRDTSITGDTQEGFCCSKLMEQVEDELKRTTCSVVRAADPLFDAETIAKDVTAVIFRRHRKLHTHSVADASPVRIETTKYRHGMASPPSQSSTPRQTRASHFIATDDTRATRSSWSGAETKLRIRSDSQHSERSSRTPETHRSLMLDDGITGKPFARVSKPGQGRESVTPIISPSATPARESMKFSPPAQTQQFEHGKYIVKAALSGPELPTKTTEPTTTTKQNNTKPKTVQVTVGISRLHMVDLPALQMKPIYWSPVNDIAVVTRATWFYRDTMFPVSVTAANQLEAGYQDLKPWTDTWTEEVNCAVEVGAAGEEKISHRLWPDNHGSATRASNYKAEPTITSDLFCASRCFQGDAAANGSITSFQPEKQLPSRPFANYQVIYKDSRTAFLLKPNLAPSSYHNRRPVAKIIKGFSVGLPVVRGFDSQAWNRLNGPKKVVASVEEVSSADMQRDREMPAGCPACNAEQDRGRITDLVLVAHGIGQKIAERVESYHFTHAINSFRRAVNIELRNPAIQNVLRADQNGFMILPLNWRVGLSFDDDALRQGEEGIAHMPEPFDLKDIEPKTIPAVRSMISDVMFDIPFYMSHHKAKMITALVKEANRVYRLWCRNNPGFSDKGRVHLIAHSLGSVMAVDILSRQPTSISRLNFAAQTELSDKFFEFNTTNLFLAGSPAGFFLLLEKGVLVPRRGRRKPGADEGDIIADNVVREAGTFGCLAVDNVYNILAKEDPIAYLLTGAIDPAYSASLKTAYVPSVTPSLMSTMRDTIRQIVPGLTPAPDPLVVEPQRPTTARMPSQLELEVHDFTREEITEKKAYLLNDNGQIDWFLRSSGGPLEIQYLNMLSAHTSYWTNQDFIRMVCLEIGRKPGKNNTFPAMRAVKKTKRQKEM